MKIMDLISQNPEITKKQLSTQVGISTTAIDKNIEKLKKTNLLDRQGSDKKGKWFIM
jgi:ATP-dependent DNA helicase RecG